MKTGMMMVATAAIIGVAMPLAAQAQYTTRDGPSRATFYNTGATKFSFGAGWKRAERFGDCIVAQDPANSAIYARGTAGSAAVTRASDALKPAFEKCRYHFQNWARYDARAMADHRLAIDWAVHRRDHPDT